MTQWNRDPDTLEARYPDERWRATCSRRAATMLLRYDHHVVWIDGRAALLLTYPWNSAPLDEVEEPLTFEVSFTYAKGHPGAPQAIQAIVESLTFQRVQ